MFAQLGADLGKQWVLNSEREVGYFDARGILLPAGTAGGDDGDPLTMTPGNHGRLDADLINGVNDEIESAVYHRFNFFRGDEILDFEHLAPWVDQANAFGHGACLGFAKRLAKGVNLPIDV